MRAVRGALAIGEEFLFHPRKLVASPAIEAGRVGGVAVEFDDVVRRNTRRLMQVIDILRDESGRLARTIKRRQRAMTAARLGFGETCLHGEPPPPGFIAHL